MRCHPSQVVPGGADLPVPLPVGSQVGVEQLLVKVQVD